MVHYLSQIIAATDRAIDRAELGSPFSLHSAMQDLTLQIILECVFGITSGPQQDRFRDLLHAYIEEGMKPYITLAAIFGLGATLREFMAQKLAKIADRLPFAGSTGSFAPPLLLARTIRDLDQLLLDDIAERRRRGPSGKTDVMSMLIAARDENGLGLTDAELHDEMLTLLLAGHETTATTLAFAMGKLLEEPALLSRAQDEIDRTVGSRPITPELLRELPFLDATIKETLRLYGPSSGFARMVAKPWRIAGYDLPAGVIVGASTYLLHRDPRFWPDPERFDPTRFLDHRPRPSEFVPFGGGLRTCLEQRSPSSR